MTPKWGFRVAMLLVGALALPGAFWAYGASKMANLGASLLLCIFYSVSELRRACFRQARVAQAMLPPGALFHASAFALPPCVPKFTCPHSHIWGYLKGDLTQKQPRKKVLGLRSNGSSRKGGLSAGGISRNSKL